MQPTLGARIVNGTENRIVDIKCAAKCTTIRYDIHAELLRPGCPLVTRSSRTARQLKQYRGFTRHEEGRMAPWRVRVEKTCSRCNQSSVDRRWIVVGRRTVRFGTQSDRNETTRVATGDCRARRSRIASVIYVRTYRCSVPRILSMWTRRPDGGHDM